MIKFVALYRTPDDPEAFDRTYFDEHVPAVLKTEGIVKSEVAKVTRTIMGEPQFYLMAELYFADLDSFKAASKSPEWQSAAGPLQQGGYFELMTMFTAEVVDG